MDLTVEGLYILFTGTRMHVHILLNHSGIEAGGTSVR